MKKETKIIFLSALGVFVGVALVIIICYRCRKKINIFLLKLKCCTPFRLCDHEGEESNGATRNYDNLNELLFDAEEDKVFRLTEAEVHDITGLSFFWDVLDDVMDSSACPFNNNRDQEHANNTTQDTNNLNEPLL